MIVVGLILVGIGFLGFALGAYSVYKGLDERGRGGFTIEMADNAISAGVALAACGTCALLIGLLLTIARIAHA